MRVLYLAHPVSGDIAANVASAKRWLRWARYRFEGDAVIAPWIPMVEVIPDDDAKEREYGLATCLAVVERCDGLIMMGPHISPGMRMELDVARHFKKEIFDLTGPNGPEDVPE